MFTKLNQEMLERIVNTFDQSFPQTKRGDRAVQSGFVEYLRVLKDRSITELSLLDTSFEFPLSPRFLEEMKEEVRAQLQEPIHFEESLEASGLFSIEDEPEIAAHSLRKRLKDFEAACTFKRSEGENRRMESQHNAQPAPRDDRRFMEEAAKRKAQYIYQMARRISDLKSRPVAPSSEIEACEKAVKALIQKDHTPYLGFLGISQVLRINRRAMEASMERLQARIRSSPGSFSFSIEEELGSAQLESLSIDFEALRQKRIQGIEKKLRTAEERKQDEARWEDLLPSFNYVFSKYPVVASKEALERAAMHDVLEPFLKALTSAPSRRSSFTSSSPRSSFDGVLLEFSREQVMQDFFREDFYQATVTAETMIQLPDGASVSLEEGLRRLGPDAEALMKEKFTEQRKAALKRALQNGIRAALEHYARTHCTVFWKTHYQALSKALHDPNATAGSLLAVSLQVLLSNTGGWTKKSMKTQLMGQLFNIEDPAVFLAQATLQNKIEYLQMQTIGKIPMRNENLRTQSLNLLFPLLTAWRGAKKCALVLDAMLSNCQDSLQKAFDTHRVWGVSPASSGMAFRAWCGAQSAPSSPQARIASPVLDIERAGRDSSGRSVRRPPKHPGLPDVLAGVA